MKLGSINNVSFGTKYYEGYSQRKDSKEEFHFEIKNLRPENYLTSNQNRVTEAIEDIIDKAKANYIYEDGTIDKNFKTMLERALEKKGTEIYFRYPRKNVVETELVKWGIGSYGDEYCYTPYNKKGDKKIKVRFSLDKMPSAESIKKKTAQFIADAKAYLTDDNNPKNKKIEDKLWEKC